MSHYASFKTEITDVVALVRALKRCRTAIKRNWTENDIEVYGKATNLYGYDNKRNDVANVIIRKNNVQPSANDIGFKREADGTYSAIISDFDQGTGEYANRSAFYGKKWQQELIQFYNLEKSKMLCEANGVECEEGKDSNGDPVLTARFKEVNEQDKMIVGL